MPPPEARKKVGNPEPPPTATHWTLQRLRVVQEASRKQSRSDKCNGPPLPDGSVPDTWPVSEFSPSNVLAIWGAGRYRVDWYSSEGERISGQLFEVASPAKANAGIKLKAPKRDRTRDVESDDQPEAYDAAPGGGGMGFMQIMALLDRTTERAERREEAKADRDRQFMLQMQQNQVAMMNAILASRGSGPTADSLQVLEQRMALQIDQAMFRLEKRFSELEPEPDDPEPDDPEDTPPKDMGEAGQRIALSFLKEIEKKTPELLAEFGPRILSFFSKQNLEPSPELMKRIRAAQAAAGANGAHG